MDGEYSRLIPDYEGYRNRTIPTGPGPGTTSPGDARRAP